MCSPVLQIADFNLSKIVETGLSLGGRSTQSPVNPRWLAPEILRGARASPASDVFSYGGRGGWGRGHSRGLCLAGAAMVASDEHKLAVAPGCGD